MHRDSIANTFVVATLLCLTCSLLVSSVATGLRSRQQANLELFRKSKVLEVAGITPEEIKQGGGVLAVFQQRIESRVIDLETGEDAAEQAGAAMAQVGKNIGKDAQEVIEKYDQVWAARSKMKSVAEQLPNSKAEDPAGLKYLEKYSHVYLLKSPDGNTVERYIFPIRGNGLWGMMMGFISLKPDLETVVGLTYYDHKETPGLGGEVDNENWKALWRGKLVYDAAGGVALQVIKGPASPDSKFDIDGLTGATITSNSVTDMVKFWMGPRGFLNFIKKQNPERDISRLDQQRLPLVDHRSAGSSFDIFSAASISFTAWPLRVIAGWKGALHV
jgi:Na+-transporting NADH:ubiquinone oxidoreductase subunit C